MTDLVLGVPTLVSYHYRLVRSVPSPNRLVLWKTRFVPESCDFFRGGAKRWRNPARFLEGLFDHPL